MEREASAANAKHDFSKGKISQHIISLAVPLTVAQLVVVLYNMVDRAFIGHIEVVGRDAFIGIGLVMPITYIITAFSNLCGTGGAPLFSIARGKGDEAEAGRIMGNAFLLILSLAAVMMILCWVFAEPLLYLVGGSETTVGYAASYLRLYLIGTLPVMLSLGMNPFINAQGFGRIGMLTVLLGAAANIALDPFFIFTLKLGVRGAALATVIAQSLSAVWVLSFLCGRRALIRLKLHALRFDFAIIRRITALGLTGFTFSATNSIVQSVGNSLLQRYGGQNMGDLYVGAMTVITSLREIVFQPIRGMTAGAQPIMGFNYGAEQYGRVRECIVFITKAVLVYSSAVWLLIHCFPQFVIRLFNSDPGLLAVGVKSIHIYYAAYFIMGLMNVGQQTFVALGHAKKAIFFSLLRKLFLAVPLMMLLPRFHGLGAYGVFASEPISDLIVSTVCYTAMMLTVWRPLGQKMTAEKRSG